jgi:hypothetical protein
MCENEFQRQANEYDGELFFHFDCVFDDVDLIKPGIPAQVILASFANSGCPVNGLRFGASLYPYTFLNWPIKSNAVAIHYMLSSIETLLNIKHDMRIRPALDIFESTNEHKILLHTLDYIIEENRLKNGICPEIQSYIRNGLLSPTTTRNQ